jgi:phosphoglycerate dehydrogenase-like enzyme
MKVLLLADWGKPFYSGLRQKFPAVDFVEAYGDADISREVADAEVVFGYLSEAQFRLGKKIRWIQTLDAGMEGLFRRIPDVVETDITVTNARGAGASQIGEHGVALMLALARGLNDFWRLKQKRKWDQEHGLSVVQMISGKTAGVIGFGKSGKEIGWRCKALGMNVIAVDKRAVDGDPIVTHVWSIDRLKELLSKSDYVFVTVPYSAENENLIGSAELASMKATAFLIVTSRGRIVEHKALVAALRGRKIAGAGLDVVIQEPLPSDNELWDLDNVIITPHIAGNSPELDQWTYDIFEDNLHRYVSAQPLKNVVDKKLRY